MSMSRKQLNAAIKTRKQINATINNLILINSEEPETVEDTIVEDYRKLNDKCDVVINKIKNRKKKSKK